MKWTKEKLILSFKGLEQRIGVRPTAEQFFSDAKTPSNMPIRQRFGNWTEFVKSMGLEPLKPSISLQCREATIKAHKGKRSFSWKGGRTKNRGYYQLYKPNHPNSNCNGYIQEHRYVMSEVLGRYLIAKENVHHINGIRDDNRIENLELWTTSQPTGQRVADKIKWAKEFLNIYENPELIKEGI